MTTTFSRDTRPSISAQNCGTTVLEMLVNRPDERVRRMLSASSMKMKTR